MILEAFVESLLESISLSAICSHLTKSIRLSIKFLVYWI